MDWFQCFPAPKGSILRLGSVRAAQALFLCCLLIFPIISCNPIVRVSNSPDYTFPGAESLEERPDARWLLRWQGVEHSGVQYVVYSREVDQERESVPRDINKNEIAGQYQFDKPVAVTLDKFYVTPNLLLKNNTCFIVRLRFPGYTDENAKELCTGRASTGIIVGRMDDPVFEKILFVNSALQGRLNAKDVLKENQIIELRASQFSERRFALVTGDKNRDDCAQLLPTEYTEAELRSNDPRFSTEGDYKICVELKNSSGKKVFGISELLKVDLTKPTGLSLSLVGGATDGYLNAAEVIADKEIVSLSGPDLIAKAYAVVPVNTESCSAVSLGYSSVIPKAGTVGALDGTRFKICARATDAAGNHEYALSSEIIVDKTPPTLLFSPLLPATMSLLKSSRMTITFADSGSGIKDISLSQGDITLVAATAGDDQDCLKDVTIKDATSRTLTISNCSDAVGL